MITMKVGLAVREQVGESIMFQEMSCDFRRFAKIIYRFLKNITVWYIFIVR